MTWEWVVLISTLVLCGTIFKIFCLGFDSRTPKNTTSLLDVENRLSQIEAFMTVAEREQQKIHELAETTKKLLSEANVAKGLRPPR